MENMGRPNTVNKTIKILKLLSNKKDMTVTEISNELIIPKSSVYNIVKTLTEEDFTMLKDKKLKTYCLGLSVYQVGMSYLSQASMYPIVHNYLEKLMLEYNTTAFYAVERNNKIVYIDKLEPALSMRTTVPLGTTREMYSTALGKAILSTYPEERILEKIDNGLLLKQKTKNTITNVSDLMEDILITRSRGYSVDNGEDRDNVFCIAAPIFNDKDKTAGAISISFLFYQRKDMDIIKVSEKILSTANEISRKIGAKKHILPFNK